MIIVDSVVVVDDDGKYTTRPEMTNGNANNNENVFRETKRFNHYSFDVFIIFIFLSLI